MHAGRGAGQLQVCMLVGYRCVCLAAAGARSTAAETLEESRQQLLLHLPALVHTFPSLSGTQCTRLVRKRARMLGSARRLAPHTLHAAVRTEAAGPEAAGGGAAGGGAGPMQRVALAAAPGCPLLPIWPGAPALTQRRSSARAATEARAYQVCTHIPRRTRAAFMFCAEGLLSCFAGPAQVRALRA